MTLFGGSFLKWSCHIINNGHNNYHHHYIFHKLLSSSMEEVLEFLFAKSTVSSVCSCACMFENGKKERIGLVGEMLCRLAPPVTFEFFRDSWASQNLSGFAFPGGGRLASMLEVGRLAFWKECKEKTAVRNSSELRGKAGDQLQWLWQ